MPIPQQTLVEQFRRLGLREGAVVVVHTSFKAVGPVEAGPLGLVAALKTAMGPTGTLVMPTMSDDDDQPFNPVETPCRGMGIVAETFRRLPGVLRSDSHASFAAEGPLAPAITMPHPLAPPHGIDSPIGRVAALGGFVLLLGVGHSENTTLHLAEVMAQVPYRLRKFCTVVQNGVPVRVEYDENDHCCERFRRMDEPLRAGGHQIDGMIGNGSARLVRSSDVLRTAIAILHSDRCAFLHRRGSDCRECEMAWDSFAVTKDIPSP